MIVPCYPTYNIYSHVAKTTTALGPVCVATSVDKMPEWDAEVIDENNFHYHSMRTSDGKVDHDKLQKLRQADVIGLYGGLTSTIPRLYSIAKKYKEMGAVVIAGGQHFIEETIEEALRSGVDYVVVGEGEEVIQKLLSAISSGVDPEGISGVQYLKNEVIIKTKPAAPITDFSRSPQPDFSLVRSAKITLYPIERIRGCGMECEFCTVKGKPRPSSPERFISQISKLVETRNVRHFFIVDDLFGQQREETIRLCKLLSEYQETIGIRLDFTAQIRLDKAKDDLLLNAMREAGINTVAIGFESPIEEDLQTMNKHIRQEEMINLVKTYHKHGFFIHGMFIFGYPSVNEVASAITIGQRIKLFRSFIRKARIDTIQILLPVPLPGTELRKRLEMQQRIYNVQNVGWEFYDGNFPLFEPQDPNTSEQLLHASQKIMGSFYRFKNLFWVGFHVFSFPAIIIFLYDIRQGWKHWYRRWRNSIIRFGGWLTLKSWRADFKRNHFATKLQQAKALLKS